MADDDDWTVVEKKKRVKNKNQVSNPNDDSEERPQNSDTTDWTPIILSRKSKRKPTGPSITVNKQVQSNKQSSSKNAVSIERKFEDDTFKLDKVNHNLQLSIQSARNAKNWTQKQLAIECNLPITVIKSYENGSAIPDSMHLSIMSKKLGVTLKNK